METPKTSRTIDKKPPVTQLQNIQRLLQNRIEKTLDTNQQREQAGFKKGYSTTDHLQAQDQKIEMSKENNLVLCIGFIDYEKAFDTVEHFAIFEALRKTNINETYRNKTSTAKLKQ